MGFGLYFDYRGPADIFREHAALLLGRPSQATPDTGRIVCACFSVGENTLKRAIANGMDSVETLGINLQAGTNCGSCIPELKKLLEATELESALN